ncbi:unnamed protein product [Symbiodinium sp. CCMP2456]|nr:unnamed protein product [Symbiodinium sp. CCMP2456]
MRWPPRQCDMTRCGEHRGYSGREDGPPRHDETLMAVTRLEVQAWKMQARRLSTEARAEEHAASELRAEVASETSKAHLAKQAFLAQTHAETDVLQHGARCTCSKEPPLKFGIQLLRSNRSDTALRRKCSRPCGKESWKHRLRECSISGPNDIRRPCASRCEVYNAIVTKSMSRSMLGCEKRLSSRSSGKLAQST